MADGKKVGELKVGDPVLCEDGVFTVWEKTEDAGGMQRVYNIVTDGGTTLLLNGVIVRQK
jgi:hypothetical protein